MRAAAVQLQSTPDRDRNLAAADRLTREAAKAGAELIVLPEKWPALGTPEQTIAAAEPLDGPVVQWAKAIARELGVDLVAGSFSEKTDEARGRNTSVHVGPDGELRATYRKIHMFDVEVGGRVYKESEHEAPGEEIVLSETANGLGLGLTICYDVRFPELYRILAVRGAEIVTVPAAFTFATTRDHWEVLLRARAIEGQAFVVAANQIGEHAPGIRSGGRSLIVDPWGVVLATAPDTETFVVAELDLERQAEIRRTLPSLANRRPEAYRWPDGGTRVVASKQAVDKRRIILDAAVRVFAREGFHACRVSDIANEAGVAYGLVYHYFKSKDQVLDTLFLERWDILLEAIRETDKQDVPAEQKLTAIAGFIIESYRHDPDLMKVIIVEVTRAANTFGATHIGKIGEAYALIRGVVEKAQETGEFRSEIPAEFAVMAFYGAIEQVLTGWIFGLLPETEAEYELAKVHIVRTIVGGLAA